MKLSHLRRTTLTVLAVITAVILAGCTNGTGGGSASNPADGQLKIAFANINDSSTFFNTITQGMKFAEEQTGYDVSYYDNNSDGQKTLENAQLMVAEQPDLIIEYYGDEGVAKAAEALFENAGIPCISLNVRGGGYCSWYNVYNPTVCGETGTALGTLAMKEGWTGDNTSVVLVAANSFGQEINTCQGYAYENIQALVPGLAQINSYQDITMTTTTVGNTTIQVDGGGLLDQSFTSVQNALASIPEDRNVIIYAIGDDMAVGAQRALDQAGRSDTALLAGFGGSAEALDGLRAGSSWVAEGDAFYTRWAEYALAMAPLVRAGDDAIPNLTTAPSAVLTRDLAVEGTSIIPISDLYADGSTQAEMLPPLIPVETKPLPGAGQDGTVGNGYLSDSEILKKFGNVTGLEK